MIPVSVFMGKIISQVLWDLLAIALSGVLTLVNIIGNFMFEPFNFSTNMFVAIAGSSFLNSIETVMISAGIAVSILLLLTGLIRVFTGKLTDDVPNPYGLVGRFVLAIFGAYWIIPIINDYIFPLAQKFFNTVLNLKTNMIGSSLNNLAENIAGKGSSILDNHTITGIASGTLANILSSGAWATISSLFALILFLICIIAAVVNLFKLVTENAERYFTINLLILSGPLAISTIVSEKASQIAKNWFNLLLSNILTIIFNLIGFKFIMLAFANCFNIWSNNTEPQNAGNALISLISLVAVSKMAQKLDQILSQIVFRINPIQNRSLLMSALHTIGDMNKSSVALTGNSLRENLGMSPIKNKDGERKGPLAFMYKNKNDAGENSRNISGVKNNQNPYDTGVTLAFGKNGVGSRNTKDMLGLDRSKNFADNGGFKTLDNGEQVDVNDAINAFKDMNGSNKLTNEQAQAMIKDINSSFEKNGDGPTHRITGFDPTTNRFTIDKSNAAINASGAGLQGDTVAALVNGDNSVRYSGTYKPRERDLALKDAYKNAPSGYHISSYNYDSNSNEFTAYYSKQGADVYANYKRNRNTKGS